MALISDPANTRSAFPNAIDSFPTYDDGTGLAQVTNGEIWNRIESALYRLEVHAAALLNFTDTPRNRVLLQTSVVIASGSYAQTATLTPNAAQYAFLGRISDQNTLLFADVRTTAAGAGPITTQLSWSAPHTVNVRFHPMDRSLTLPAGTYTVRVTLLN